MERNERQEAYKRLAQLYVDVCMILMDGDPDDDDVGDLLVFLESFVQRNSSDADAAKEPPPGFPDLDMSFPKADILAKRLNEFEIRDATKAWAADVKIQFVGQLVQFTVPEVLNLKDSDEVILRDLMENIVDPYGLAFGTTLPRRIVKNFVRLFVYG